MQERLSPYIPKDIHRTPARAHLLVDLDGVFIRWANSGYLANHTEQAKCYEALETAKAKGIHITGLTNRSAEQLSPLTSMLGVTSGIWVTENGGTLYDVYRHKSVVAPEWLDVARIRVPVLRTYLAESLQIERIPTTFNAVQFEPGMGYVKTVLIPPENADRQTFVSSVEQILQAGGFLPEFEIHSGKGIDIDPVGLSKGPGMRLLLDVNGIDPRVTPTIWIADAQRDIAAGEMLLASSGLVAAVGNADEQYKSFVAQAGGIVAPEDTAYFSSVTHILTQVFNQFNL